MADAWYKGYIQRVVNGLHDWEYYDCHIMLLTDAYDPAGVDTHVVVSDINSWEVAGAGYTQGGMLLVDGAVGWAVDAGAQTISLTISADPEWTPSTITARYAALYTNNDGDTPTDYATASLVALLDFGENVSTAGGTFTVPFSVDGVVLRVNAGTGDVGYQLHLLKIFQAYPTSPFSGEAKTVDLLASTYNPDYENHNDNADTFSHLVGSFDLQTATAMEGDDFVYRQDNGVYTFTNFTGTFRYVSVRRSTNGELGVCIDLGSDVVVSGQDVILNFTDGYMKLSTSVGVQ